MVPESSDPWLPVADNCPVINVRSEDADPQSLLTLYRRLLNLRRSHQALVEGGYEPGTLSDDLLLYIRRSPYGSLLVALNFANAPFDVLLDSLGAEGRIILSTHLDRDDQPIIKDLALRAHEGVIVELTNPPTPL